MTRPPNDFTGPDGFSGPVAEAPRPPARLADEPWRAVDVRVVDASGRNVATALTYEFSGPLEQRFALAQARAQRIADSVNLAAHHRTMIAAAKLQARHQAFYEVAHALHLAYAGLPQHPDGGCLFCAAPAQASSHDADCPLPDLNAAWADEHDGHGWIEVHE